MNNSELCEIAKKHEDRGDLEKAYQYYLEAALSEDDGEAMYALARMYFEGNFLREDYDKAGRYIGFAFDRKAKIKPWTLIMAGNYWQKHSEESAENLIFAEKYYQAAADLGVRYGHECLGELYYARGDYEKAYEHLLQMEKRNPLGFYYMGRLYDEGHAVEQDMDKAVEYYKKAIECALPHEEEYGEDEHCALAKERLKELGLGKP